MEMRFDSNQLVIGKVAIPMGILKALGTALDSDDFRKRIVFRMSEKKGEGVTVTEFTCESAKPVEPELCKCGLPKHPGYCWQARRFARRNG